MAQANLIISDEVTVKVEGLDLSTRKKLHEMFKFEIPGARYQPSVRLGRWDGKKSFFGLSGLTYINLLPEIIEALNKLHYDIEVIDNRTYNTSFTFNTITEDSFADKNWPPGHVKEGTPVMFRDYQVELLNNFVKNTQCIQEIATGAGKCLAGGTKILISVNEDNAFGKFVLNKVQQGQENDVTRDNKKL